MSRIGPCIVVGVAWAAVAAAQNVTVQSPNGGEQWKAGTNHAITWVQTGTDKVPALDIVLIKGTVELGFIAQNVPVSPASRTWVVGQYSGGTAPVGTDYKVGIRETGSTEQDTSNAFFSIVGLPAPPAPVTLKLTSPNAGGEWKKGASMHLSWSSTNLTGKVKLELVREPNTPAGDIATDLPVNGTRPWNAGDLKGGGTAPVGTYRVRVRSQANPARYDDSDQTFELTRAFVRPPFSPRPLNQITKVPAVIQNWMGKDAWPEQYTIPQAPIQARPTCDAGGNQRALVGRDWFQWENIQLAKLYRSRVSLNVAPLQGQAGQLRSAKLRLKQISALTSNTTWVSCGLSACELAAPWTSFDPFQAGHCYSLSHSQAEYTVDITETMRKWIDGSLPNNGLLLVSSELPMSNLWTCFSCFEATFELDMQ